MKHDAQRSRAALLALAVLTTLFQGCADGGSFALAGNDVSGTAALARRATSARWIPGNGTTYQIEYQYPNNKLDTSDPAQVYDVDWQDTTAAQVSALHAHGRHAMCYVSVGTWENWRPDASTFPKSAIGNRDGGWAGERWLDIRQTAVLEPIEDARFAICKSKGFDGVDPDNLDGFENHSGFPLTYAEQLAYDVWVAQDVHARGMTVSQKGDNDQVNDLYKYFDFAVVEQCFVQHFCNEYQVYSKQNHLVVDVEYGLTPKGFQQKTCPSDARYHETAILKHLNLNPWIVTCTSSNGRHS